MWISLCRSLSRSHSLSLPHFTYFYSVLLVDIECWVVQSFETVTSWIRWWVQTRGRRRTQGQYYEGLGSQTSSISRYGTAIVLTVYRCTFSLNVNTTARAGRMISSSKCWTSSPKVLGSNLIGWWLPWASFHNQVVQQPFFASDPTSSTENVCFPNFLFWAYLSTLIVFTQSTSADNINVPVNLIALFKHYFVCWF